MTLIERLAGIAAKFKPAEKLTSLFAKKSPTEASLYLYDAITPEGLGGISAKQVVEALAEAQGVQTLHVRINSVGGAVFEAKAIYQALKEFPANKVVHVDGLAASAASFIAMAGDHIITAPEATWFIHGAQSMTLGGEQAHRDTADLLAKESANLRAIYQKRTGQVEADLKAWMDAETFMNAEEAMARGFTDSIEGQEPTNAAPATQKLVALSNETKFRIAQANVAALRIKREAASRTTSPGPAPTGSAK